MSQLCLLSQIHPEISRYGRIKQHCFGVQKPSLKSGIHLLSFGERYAGGKK